MKETEIIASLARAQERQKISGEFGVNYEVALLTIAYDEEVMDRYHERRELGAIVFIRWPHGASGPQLFDYIVDEVLGIELAMSFHGSLSIAPLPDGDAMDWDVEPDKLAEFIEAWKLAYRFWVSYFQPPAPPFRGKSDEFDYIDMSDSVPERARLRSAFRDGVWQLYQQHLRSSGGPEGKRSF